jgi:integrase
VTELPRELTPLEREAVSVALQLIGPGRRPRAALMARRTLQRHLEPLEIAARELALHRTAQIVCLRAALTEMSTTGEPYAAWGVGSWTEAAECAGRQRNAMLSLAWHLGCITAADAVAAGIHPTYLARRIFGREALEREVGRLLTQMKRVGFRHDADRNHSLPGAVARLLVVAGHCELEAITIDLLERLWLQESQRSSLRRALFRIAHLMHGMGLIPRDLRVEHPRQSLDAVDPCWSALANRWCATSTLARKTREGVFYGVLRAGRWLALEHSSIRSPEGWTRELAAAYVAAIDRGCVGELCVPGHRLGGRDGLPLSPRSKDRLLQSVRVFFKDCRDWGWCELRFDPQRALATPRSVQALMSRDPRVIADDLWAKLLWAGLDLGEGDQPVASGGPIPGQRRPVYPLALVKALAVTWLFAGLRVNELVRLPVGCIRWQDADGAPGASSTEGRGTTCLLDVPVHKTGSSYTKPVDPVVGQVIASWEAQRPPQPALRDRKTGQPTDLLFAFRGTAVPGHYINGSVIPALCRKAGIPLSDARGRITSHRARSTIASQLYNAKEPMTLFELQEWLGHRSPATTQYYVRITPTKLAKAYSDAGYFARNVRAIEVLVDRDAVQRGAAAAGEPWQYFDLGHGYCTYSFFEQCQHRMACARCDFYVPKSSTRSQLLEARTHLQRMLVEIPLTDDEQAAVEDGDAAVGGLLERLADVPTPAGPTPRELSQRSGSVLLPMLEPPRSRPPEKEIDR